MSSSKPDATGADAIDLPAYFRRIGFDGPHPPSLATLAKITALHPTAIAFENLDVLTGRPINLDLPSLQGKLVQRRRGGYCHEQNSLLLAVLRQLGFSVTGLIGRVRWGVPPDVVTGRGHMVLRVDLPEGPYLTDVGFGSRTLTAPLALVPGLEQATSHEVFRVSRDGGEFVLETQHDGAWLPVYRFDEVEQFPVDYETANWYSSTHPRALFTNMLLVTRPLPGRRLTLANNVFAVRHLDGRSERRTLEGRDELAEVLGDEFGLEVPDAAGLDMLLAAVQRRLASGAVDRF